jgi:hypothetical protein
MPTDGNRAVVLRGVVAAGLVLARDSGQGGGRSEERQPDWARCVDRLGDLRRSVGADERDRSRIARRGLGCLRRTSAAMRDVLDAGGAQSLVDGCSQ